MAKLLKKIPHDTPPSRPSCRPFLWSYPPEFLTGGPVSSPSTSAAPRPRPLLTAPSCASPPLPPFLLSCDSPSTPHLTALETTVPRGLPGSAAVCIGLALLGADGTFIPCLFQLLQAMVILPHSEPASYLSAPQAASLGLSMSCLPSTCKDPCGCTGPPE